MVQINKSELKDVRNGLVKSFPLIKEIVDDLLPKKAIVYKMRLKHNEKTDLYIYNDKVVCFRYFKHYIPILKIFHKCKLIRPTAG